MPTIPLFTPPKCPDAWHQVASPGGYEQWYFDAEDAATDMRIVAVFSDGDPFHPAYLRKYSAYLRRPTRRTPPVARDYPGVSFAAYRNGKVLARFTTQYPAGSLIASTDVPDVTVGPNHVKRNADGGYELHLEDAREKLVADITLTPKFTHGAQRELLWRPQAGPEQRWLIAAPLCDLFGVIRFTPPREVEQTVEVRGRGYHDHYFGTGPRGSGLKWYIRGRVLLEDRALIFRLDEPKDARLLRGTYLIEADRDSVRELIDQQCTLQGSHHLAIGLACPQEMRFGDELKLTDPREVDRSPFSARVMYGARLRNGVVATASCEVMCPQRLRGSLGRRMLEKLIRALNES